MLNLFGRLTKTERGCKMKICLQKRIPKVEVLSSLMVAFVIALGDKVFLLGNLVQKFGLSKGDAAWAVGLVASGAATLIAMCWPMLAPYLLTLRGLIATIGAGAAASW